MIAKAIKGRGFRGALAYDLQKEQGRLIDSNMEGRTPRELAKEFGEIRKLRPGLGKAVLHVSLSAAPGERLSDATWAEIGRHYLAGMGLTSNQYVTTRHADTEHEHIHLVVNRITFDGKVVSDSHDYRRQEATMREVERDYQLQTVAASKDVLRRAASRGEIEGSMRTNTASTKQRLQQLCDGALDGCSSYNDYAERLEAAGVSLVPVTQLNDTKLSGLSYVLDGVMMKGSDLGKGYSPMGLSKRGVSYEQGRDIAAVSRQREREEAGRLDAADRDTTYSEAGERGAAGRAAGATGAGHGSADGRNARDVGIGGGAIAPAGGADRQADRGRSKGVPGSGTERAALGAAPGGRRAEHESESVRSGVRDRPAGGDARELIVALASTGTDSGQSAGPKAGSGVPGPRDRSYEAVERQMRGMACKRYEILLVDASGQAKQLRQWSEGQVLLGVPWLKRMNARGHDVLVRPMDQSRPMLLDRLTHAKVNQLERSGIPLLAKIEVDADRFQVWLRLGNESISSRVRAALAKGLGLPKSESDKFGALAGFVTHQSEVIGERNKFVLAHAPVKPDPEANAKWERMLVDAENLVRDKDRDKSQSRDKGISR
ncbi:MAG: relaxase/mobilization nuclease domain-containing protein [Pseudomonadota bacterium]